ncbi:MAG: transcriptional repressor LexA [Negativicutes bacterium]|nr:transcriptional repressor LexA [Negativicutes bacterium]
MTRPRLGAKQRQILDYISQVLQDKGYPPSVREIAAATGLASTSSVHAHLQKLESLGLIRRDAAKFRSIALTDDHPLLRSACNLPKLGAISAGQPLLAEENIEEYLPLPLDWADYDRDAFILTIHGDSMINAGICDGDLVIVRPQNDANNGDIVAALIDDEQATVKRFYRRGRQIVLQPENDAYQPLSPQNVRIIGKVVGLYRHY